MSKNRKERKDILHEGEAREAGRHRQSLLLTKKPCKRQKSPFPALLPGGMWGYRCLSLLPWHARRATTRWGPGAQGIPVILGWRHRADTSCTVAFFQGWVLKYRLGIIERRRLGLSSTSKLNTTLRVWWFAAKCQHSSTLIAYDRIILPAFWQEGALRP